MRGLRAICGRCGSAPSLARLITLLAGLCLSASPAFASDPACNAIEKAFNKARVNGDMRALAELAGNTPAFCGDLKPRIQAALKERQPKPISQTSLASKRNKQRKDEEEEAWFSTPKTIYGIQSFLSRYPDGNYAENAKLSLKSILDDESAWSKASSEDTKSSYKLYLQRWNLHRSEAKTALERFPTYRINLCNKKSTGDIYLSLIYTPNIKGSYYFKGWFLLNPGACRSFDSWNDEIWVSTLVDGRDQMGPGDFLFCDPGRGIHEIPYSYTCPTNSTRQYKKLRLIFEEEEEDLPFP